MMLCQHSMNEGIRSLHGSAPQQVPWMADTQRSVKGWVFAACCTIAVLSTSAAITAMSMCTAPLFCHQLYFPPVLLRYASHLSTGLDSFRMPHALMADSWVRTTWVCTRCKVLCVQHVVTAPGQSCWIPYLWTHHKAGHCPGLDYPSHPLDEAMLVH